MEYNIMKLYEKNKKESPKVEKGFELFTRKHKRRMICWLTEMILAAIVLVVLELTSLEVKWMLLALGASIIGGVMCIYISYDNEKTNLEQYEKSYRMKLDILDDIIVKKYNLGNRAKIEELIERYQEFIERRKEEHKKIEKMIYVFCSVVGAVILNLLNNRQAFGISIENWLVYVEVILVITMIVVSVLYVLVSFDTEKIKYEMMIKDLKSLLIIKY